MNGDDSKTKHWVFACDGNVDVGLGHLSRCLGLAESLQECGDTIIFVGQFGKDALLFLDDAGFEYVQLFDKESWESIFQSKQIRGDFLVLDSYLLNNEKLDQIRQTWEESFVMIDDFASHRSYPCDAIINFTLAAQRSDYPERENCFLLGANYYPARRWLWDAKKQRSARTINHAEIRILIIAGGGDPNGVTKVLLSALEKTKDVLIKAVVPDHLMELEISRNVELLRFSPSPTELFVWADLCLCGGGLTKYDCMFLGLPYATFAQTAEQYSDTLKLEAMGLVFSLGLTGETTFETLRERLEHFLKERKSNSVLANKTSALFRRENISEIGLEVRRLLS